MNLVKFFDFIKEKRGYNTPLRYKLINGLPISDEELNVKGELDLSDSKIVSLPDNLKVMGYLDLHGSNIKSLPDNFNVDGSLRLTYSKIESLPDNLNISGNLLLSYTKIESLPGNLKVGNSLHLYSTPLSKKYSKEEIKKMIEDKGGYVNGKIMF